MNFPIPPTDSLYKFVALLGAIILVVSIVGPYLLSRDMEAQIDQISLKDSTLNIAIDYTERRIENLKEIIHNSILRQNGQYKPDPNKLEIEYSPEEIKHLEEQIVELTKSSRMDAAEVELMAEKNHRLFSELKTIMLCAFGAALWGVVMMFYGFRNWYYRIQRYQDRLLEADALRILPGQPPTSSVDSDADVNAKV